METVHHRQNREETDAMVGMWQTLTSVSSILGSVPPGDIPRELDNALRVLASHGKEDRCTLFLLTGDGRYLERAHAWSAPGVRPYPEYFHRFRLDAFPWLRACIEGLELIHVPRVEDIPHEEGAWGYFLRSRGVRSLLVIPLVRYGAAMGCMSFESTSRCRIWDPGSISLFKAASVVVANACMRKRGEEELAASRESLRSLSSELILAEEKERRRIASDIHDRIGHALAASCMKLKALEKKAPPDLRHAVRGITGLVEELIQETHTLTFSISPPVLYDFGLQAAVEWLAEETRRQHGLNIRLSCSIDDGQVDFSSRVLAYQAIRELLFNTVKHARARNVVISVTSDSGLIRTVIEDDGLGFPSPGTARGGEKGGFGLFNIREKLSSRGGKLLVESRPDRGTRVTMVSPVSGSSSA